MWVGVTGWDEGRLQKKESDRERTWGLIGGWMDRQDDERATRTRNEGKKQMMRV